MKKWTKEEIWERISTDKRWFERGLMAIHKNQTRSEQAHRVTMWKNRVGFTAPDARFMSIMAEKVGKKDYIYAEDMHIARCKMKKYCEQLAKIANGKIQAVF